MKANTMAGLVAGGIIGVATAMIAVPLLEPELGKRMRKGKRMLRKKINKMM